MLGERPLGGRLGQFEVADGRLYQCAAALAQGERPRLVVRAAPVDKAVGEASGCVELASRSASPANDNLVSACAARQESTR